MFHKHFVEHRYQQCSKKGRIRPIAVENVLRRFIAEFLAKELISEAIELFQSLQLGVGVKDGAKPLCIRLSFCIKNSPCQVPRVFWK